MILTDSEQALIRACCDCRDPETSRRLSERIEALGEGRTWSYVWNPNGTFRFTRAVLEQLGEPYAALRAEPDTTFTYREEPAAARPPAGSLPTTRPQQAVQARSTAPGPKRWEEYSLAERQAFLRGPEPEPEPVPKRPPGMVWQEADEHLPARWVSAASFKC